MKTVAESEVEDHLTLLLDEVELGAAIAITRRGKPVATLAPIAEDYEVRQPLRKHSSEEVRTAMLRVREQAKAAGKKFNWDEVKNWRDEGRA